MVFKITENMHGVALYGQYNVVVMPRCACAQRAYGSHFVCLSVCLSVPAISVPPVEIK